MIYDRTRAREGFKARLYNVIDDPEEQSPVAGEIELAASLLEELMAWRDGESYETGEEIEIDAETLEHLKAVGYID